VATGKRAAARPARRFRPDILGLAVAITLLALAWGYLVYTAIGFGGSARDGESRAWLFLGLATLGAVACLFAGLILAVRLLHRLADGPAPLDQDDSPQRPHRH